MRCWIIALAALAGSTPALAEKQVTCSVKQVMHTRYGVLVNCEETTPDKIFNGVENIDWYAPDARLTKNGNGIAPDLSVGETMLGFEEVALEAFRSKQPLLIAFAEGMRPGGLFDCLNTNCRLARAWTVRSK